MTSILKLLALLPFALYPSCVAVSDPSPTHPSSIAQVPSPEKLLRPLGEEGQFKVTVQRYDPTERIAHVFRKRRTGWDAGPINPTLAREFAHGRTLPYQFDGTRWIPIWSPSFAPLADHEKEILRFFGTIVEIKPSPLPAPSKLNRIVRFHVDKGGNPGHFSILAEEADVSKFQIGDQYSVTAERTPEGYTCDIRTGLEKREVD